MKGRWATQGNKISGSVASLTIGIILALGYFVTSYGVGKQWSVDGVKKMNSSRASFFTAAKDKHNKPKQRKKSKDRK